MSRPHFTPRQLDAFIAGAELSSFTQAGRRLHLTPSAISNLITELETTLGFVLFERTTRKVALTNAGRQFLTSAIAVQRQLTRASSAAVDIRNHATDVVRVAAPMSVASMLLPAMIARHRQIAPRTTIRIIDTGVEWLSDRVSIGEADLAIGPDRAVQADVVRTKLFATPWVAWCAPDHPLARSDQLRWQDLHGIDVYAAGRDHEQGVLPLLPPSSAAANVVPVQIVENISTALGLAAAGLGLTFSPDYVAPFAATLGLVMRPLVEPDIVRYMCLYEPDNRPPTEAVLAFKRYIIEAAKMVFVT